MSAIPKYKFYLFILTIVFSAPFHTLQAQYYGFSQFYANPLNTNPALAGSSTKQETASGRAALHYANGFPGLPNAYMTFTGSWDQALDKLHGGVGAQVSSNSMYGGGLVNSEIRGFYSLHSSIGKSKKYVLLSGIQLSYYQRSTNWDLRFGDAMIPGDTGQPKSSVGFFNPAVGVVWSNPKYYIGVAVHNVLEPNQSFFNNPSDVLPRQFTVHAGYYYTPSGASWSLQPQTLFAKQGSFTDFKIGTLLLWKFVQSGIWYRQTWGQYRNSDALFFNLGYQNDHFRLLYSYGFTVSDGRSAVPSTHEIALTYRWKTKQTAKLESPLLY